MADRCIIPSITVIVLTDEERDKKEDRGRRETGRKADDEGKGSEDVIVVSADEVGIEHEATLRRAWYAKNTKMKLRVDRSGSLRSTSGSSTSRTGAWISCARSGATPRTS